MQVMWAEGDKGRRECHAGTVMWYMTVQIMFELTWSAGFCA